MKKILREPLFHFLVIGALLFLVYSMLNKNQREDEIIIDDYVINDLSAKWKMQWQRDPGVDELEKLVGLYIDQEVLYREALAMNLDHNDEIIKRRLAKKMEFISDDLAESLQPSADLLRKYYNDNIDDYRKPPIYSFTQAYFKEKEAAIQALAEDNPAKFSDKLLIPVNYTDVDGLKIAIDFGSTFAKSLDTLALNKWVGPISSGFGNHLVFISEKTLSGTYTYEEVADKVNLDYNFYASKKFKRELINTLLKGYKLNFDLSDKSLKTKLSENY
jgi:parvulin-like peptidyl-prolyl cis-trans isomerase-like protein